MSMCRRLRKPACRQACTFGPCSAGKGFFTSEEFGKQARRLKTILTRHSQKLQHINQITESMASQL
jgi:hypothetical protein